ncbi:hypothetical protein Pelo_3036 [Pelomyxa schiedti]|nr:hypothetical protein Pelo_3036 [Pelomyxa schiedti]
MAAAPTNTGEVVEGTCAICDDTNPAEFKCETCGMLCAKHLNKVHKLPAFKMHVAIDLRIGRPTAVTAGTPPKTEQINDLLVFRESKILTTRELDNKLHGMVVGAEGAMGHTMTNAKWRLLWRGSADCFTAEKFHELCDNIAPTLSIVRTTTNYICGAYTNLPFGGSEGTWRGGCGGRTFIYSLVRAGTTTGTILRCTDHHHCIYCRDDYGPTYGFGHSLHICNDCNTLVGSYTSLSNAASVEPPPHDPPNEYLTGSCNGWLVADIEVWTLALFS